MKEQENIPHRDNGLLELPILFHTELETSVQCTHCLPERELLQHLNMAKNYENYMKRTYQTKQCIPYPDL